LTRLVRGTLNAVVPDDLSEVEVAAGPVAGARMLLDLHREKSFWAGTYEPWVQETIGDLLTDGGAAWDVGAHVGYHTLLFHRLCGPQRVVAIEPNPTTRDRLEANLRLNHVLGVNVVAGAAWACAGTGSMVHRRDPAEDAATNEIIPGAEVIRLLALDDLLDCLAWPGVVKMDIEGGEAGALAGATKLLHDVRPHFIVELHKRAGIQAISTLRAAGYTVRAIDRTNSVTDELRAGGTRHILATP
jgi:FkbM family methyltransferase